MASNEGGGGGMLGAAAGAARAAREGSLVGRDAVFLKVAGVPSEEGARQLMVEQMGSTAGGRVEYVALIGDRAHVLKCFDPAAAAAIAGYRRVLPHFPVVCVG